MSDVLISEESNSEEENLQQDKMVDIESSYYNNGKLINAKLFYSGSFVLLNSECSLFLNKTNRLEQFNGWNFLIEFTNKPLNGSSAPEMVKNLNNIDYQKIAITCHNWYGTDMENNTPLEIFSPRHLVTFLVKIRTTSFLSQPNKRDVNISIWQKF